MHGLGICNTPYGWCPLRNPEQIPAGSPCYCTTLDNRAVMGWTEPRGYLGDVSPYFNRHLREIDVPTVPAKEGPVRE